MNESDAVERFLQGLPREVEEIARALRDAIREVVPEAVEKRRIPEGCWRGPESGAGT